jgi:hypothetical protein
MKPKSSITPEQIREQARHDDRKGAAELQKALTKMARNFSKMTLDQLMDMTKVRSPGNGNVVGYSGAVLKDIATAIEKIQRVSMLALQDTPAERSRREPAADQSAYEQHKIAIDAEVEQLLELHDQAIDVKLIESSTVDIKCTPVADTDATLPAKPLKIKYDPSDL